MRMFLHRLLIELRRLQEMTSERAVPVDHSTGRGWAIKLLPALANAFRPRKHGVGRRWRMNETDIKVKGEWKCHGTLPQGGETSCKAQSSSFERERPYKIRTQKRHHPSRPHENLERPS